jgi:hypothetical protein
MANTTGQKFGGRTKGTSNKTTTELREKFSLLIENNFDKLQQDIDLLEPKERVKTILELARFVVPTLKASELTTDSNNSFQPITITFVDSKDDNDK